MNERYVPIFVEASKYRIMVFGGGNVALRKCRYFQGADITVMTREILPELKEIVSKVIIGEIPDDVKDMIDPYDLVIAATDNKELNAKIRSDAVFMGISVNSAHGGGNVLIPSVLKRDKYTVAVSSQGRVPAFPPYIIDVLDGYLDERYDRMLDLMIEMREYALANISPQHKRREFMESVINDPEIRATVADGKMKEAKKLALKKAKA